MFYLVGITGNYYFTSNSKLDLIKVCKNINKSINSIYWSIKYNLYAIRIKNKNTKKLIKELYDKKA